MKSEAWHWNSLNPGGRFRVTGSEETRTVNLVDGVQQAVPDGCGSEGVPGALIASQVTVG